MSECIKNVCTRHFLLQIKNHLAHLDLRNYLTIYIIWVFIIKNTASKSTCPLADTFHTWSLKKILFTTLIQGWRPEPLDPEYLPNELPAHLKEQIEKNKNDGNEALVRFNAKYDWNSCFN